MNEQSPLYPATLDLSIFEAHLNSVFTITARETGETLSLTLVEATAYPDHRPEELKKGRAPFSIVFACPDLGLPGGTYCLEHKELGSLTIFLSPFEAFEKGCKLEAVFN